MLTTDNEIEESELETQIWEFLPLNGNTVQEPENAK